ncbi:MAG: indoleamine 2,3-dioxygenase [Cellvibrionaceae bacterium]|jgi:indoleamine 2,3-dioxygenase
MLDLKDYDVDPDRGFLPAEDPLTQLPPEFAEWDQLSADLPYLVLTSRVRSTLANLKTPDLDLLNTQGELERAMLIISALSMAYIWVEQPEIKTLPKQLAKPWAAIAEKLGRPPMITHSSVVLNNWRRLDPNDGIHADNLACTQHFMGGMDEQWFFTATTALEAIGAPALQSLVDAKAAAEGGDVARVTELLQTICEIFKEVNVALMRIWEKCDPHIFYNRIRIFVAGWDQTGLLYEGVSDIPLKMHGGSAAQSSLLQAYDAALGIEHLHPETQPFLSLMREYMPPKHRQFVEDLVKGTTIFDFVQAQKSNSAELADNFNQCIDQLDEFRRAHMEIAVVYVLKQGKNGEDGLGTGGTSFVPFLSEARKETKAKKIKQ